MNADMTNRSENILYAYLPITLVAFLFAPPLFSDQENNKEEFFKILSTEIPKSKNIIYISKNYGGTSTRKSKPIVTIKAMNDDGSENIPIIEGRSIYSIKISPDKNKLLLISPDHSPQKNYKDDWLNSHIWLYIEGKLKQLTHGMVMDSDAIWSPSGDKIYFSRSKIFSDVVSGKLMAEETNIWVMNPDGSEIRQLTFSKNNIINTTPLPIKNSNKILFTTNRNKKWQMFIMDEDGSNQIFFIDNGMLGSWSPDGKFLAFMNSSPGDIYLASREGKLIRKLTKEGDVNFSPAWSPDGQYLTYSRINAMSLRSARSHKNTDTPRGFLLEEPYSDIWKLSINKKEAPKRLTYKGLNNNFPQWITIHPQ